MTRVERALNEIKNEIEEKTVLEVACGCAEFSVAASKIATKVNCIDLDSFRLNQAISNCHNVEFEIMAATDMHYSDGTFDTVILYNAISHLETIIPAIFKECKRVLNTNGSIFIISSFGMDKVVIEDNLIPYLSNNNIAFSHWTDKIFVYVQIKVKVHIMQIKHENIILRDMIESDIEDYVRWFTTETEWSNTDAPWEPIESDEETERKSWREYYESVKDLADDVRRWKFEIEWNGRHIGWVSSYPIDENYEWIGEIKDGQTVYRAIGIDICEPDVWGNGIGTNALRAFMNYYFENGVDELYTQTWSGNVRMLRCAEKLGFLECNRNVGTREVDGQKYDGLTFRLKK